MQNDNLESNEGQKLRHTFIAMLFAFVVSVLAVKAVDLLSVLTSGWSSGFSILQISKNFTSANYLLMVPFAHLILAFTLVSMSWVMWSRSQSSGLKQPIDSFVSIPFFILLVEMGLVVLYFALTNTVEQDINAYNNSKKIEDFVKDPTAQAEAQILILVFFCWFLWDIVCDVMGSKRDIVAIGFWNKLFSPVQGILTYSSASFLCLLACLLVSYVADSKNPSKIILADMALLSVLVWFRPAKKIEYFLIKIFPAEATRQNTKHDKSPSKVDVFWFVAPIAAFSLLLYFASGFSLCRFLQS